MDRLDFARLEKAKQGIYINADVQLSNGQDLMDASKNGYKFPQTANWTREPGSLVTTCKTCKLAWIATALPDCKCSDQPVDEKKAKPVDDASLSQMLSNDGKDTVLNLNRVLAKMRKHLYIYCFTITIITIITIAIAIAIAIA